jgi:aspartokinase-like uncharacterized kinase
MNTADDFNPHTEVMDISKLKDKTFIVGISSGDRDKVGIVSTTIRGPYNFLEMLDAVSHMWNSRMDHAKVIVLNKEVKTKTEWLDAKTVDYIIEKAADIALEEVLLSDDKEYTCEAGLVSSDKPDFQEKSDV